jgi:hypothetical protein
MTSGIVRDIRTGRALFKTDSLTDTFIAQVSNTPQPFFMVHGRCTKLEVRMLVSDLKEMKEFPMVYDRQMPPDAILLFAGEPHELGFRLAS